MQHSRCCPLLPCPPACACQINSLTGVTLPAGIICLGVFVLLLSICGALAVWHESRVGLLLYALFLLCIVISLFALGIAVYVEKDQAGSYISRGWQLSPPDVRQALEVEFACCGLNQFPVNATSCPPPSQVAIPQNQTCLPLLVSAFQSNYVTAGGCGIAFAVLMGCFIALAVLLVRGVGIKRQQTAEAEDSRRASRAAMERSGGGGVGAGVDYEGTNTEGEDSFDDEDDEEDDEEEDDELT